MSGSAVSLAVFSVMLFSWLGMADLCQSKTLYWCRLTSICTQGGYLQHAVSQAVEGSTPVAACRLAVQKGQLQRKKRLTHCIWRWASEHGGRAKPSRQNARHRGRW